MAKNAKHDVFDMSDDIARIKRTKSVEVSDVGDSGNDLSYTTGKGSQRRVAKDTDKMVNFIGVSAWSPSTGARA